MAEKRKNSEKKTKRHKSEKNSHNPLLQGEVYSHGDTDS